MSVLARIKDMLISELYKNLISDIVVSDAFSKSAVLA